MTTKLFPSNSLLLLGPIFLITTDFVITRFSQTGGPKKLANNTKQHASNSIMSSSYNTRVHRLGWIQNQVENESSWSSSNSK
ncbi:hypothetical protein JTP64_004806 [Candida tropicalis]|nr:hypothetical protein JTP64_004806 [Candida tropicalis]